MGDFQNADQAIAAGNDMMLSSTQKEIIDETAGSRQLVRKACHNILYVVAKQQMCWNMQEWEFRDGFTDMLHSMP